MTASQWYASGQIVNIHQHNVFIKRYGKGENLLCIHGYPSSSYDFSFIFPSLTSKFDCIILDLIGLGKSEKPSHAITISLQADIIEALLLSQGIVESHILAHDLGDTIAQELLARQFENSSKIKWLSCVFLNGGLFPETHKPLMIQKLLLTPLGPIVSIFASKASLKKSFIHIFSKAHPPTDAFIDETWLLLTERNGKNMLHKLIQYINERKRYRERWLNPLIEGIVPIRLINGIEDPISGIHAAQRFEELIPHADVILLKNSGHYPHVETPEDVLIAFFKFHQNMKNSYIYL